MPVVVALLGMWLLATGSKHCGEPELEKTEKSCFSTAEGWSSKLSATPNVANRSY